MDNAQERLKETHAAALASIVDMVARLEDPETEEEAREEIENDALSVEVRTSWHVPGGDAGKPDEYRILITTGGPAVQIVGDLNEYGEPDNARLQVQDWFQPWTEFPTSSEEDDALEAYARCFYFGE